MPLSGLLIFAITELVKLYILCIFVLICIIEVSLYINNMHGFTFHNIVQTMYRQCTSVHKPQQRFLVFKKLCVQQNKGNTKSPSFVQLHLQWL